MFEFTYPTLSNPEAYLERIGYHGGLEANRENLDALIYAHQCAVPFENLSCCGYAEPNTLEVGELFHKVVEKRRGGYCFELNSLFLTLLRALGYDAYSCMARIAANRDFLRPVFHRGIIVRLDGKRYYCDVGFGGTMAAFAVELSEKQRTAHGETYWVEGAEEGWKALWRRFETSKEGDPGQVIVIFGPQPFLAEDYDVLHQYSARNTNSPHTRGASLYRRTPTGYISLMRGMFTEYKDGDKTVRPVSAEELPAFFKEYFDIEI